MADIKGTQTEKNLLTAFAGESQARNRYTLFAEKAIEEGYIQIAEIFEITAKNEYEHAKRLFSFLEGGELEISAAFPAGKVGTTLENLKASAEGENYEYTSMYPEFAETAKAEGFPQIAAVLKSIAIAEDGHEKRFLKLADNVKNCNVFKKENKQVWKCIKCGYIHTKEEAPKVCPVCLSPQDYFELASHNY